MDYKLLESLSKAECTHMKQNYYLFDYYDKVLQTLGDHFAIDFSKQIRSQGEIKTNFSKHKKTVKFATCSRKKEQPPPQYYQGFTAVFSFLKCKIQEISVKKV